MLSVSTLVDCVIGIVSVGITVVDGVILAEVISEELEVNSVIVVDSVCDVYCDEEADGDGIEVDNCNMLEGIVVAKGIPVELDSILLVSGDCDVDTEVVIR